MLFLTGDILAAGASTETLAARHDRARTLLERGAQAAKHALALDLLAQKDFLKRHVIEWVPKFCIKLQKLQNSEDVPFYAGFAQIASGFITYEFDILKDNTEILGSVNPLYLPRWSFHY